MNIKTYNIAEFVENFAIKEISREAYEEVTTLSLSEYQKTQKQYADPKYQRIFGAWDHKQKCAYIESLFHKEAYNPIVLAEILTKDDTLPRSIKFACLDGQHRSTVICEFIDNKFGFTGSLNIDGEIREFTNTLFKDLNKRIRKVFLERSKVCVLIVENKSENNLRNIFLQINSGEPLNRQEKRNALDTYIAEWSRRQTEKHGDIFKQISKIGSQIHRMSDRQYTSKVALFLSEYDKNKIIETKDNELDAYYNSKEYNYSMLEYISNHLFSSLSSIALSHKRKNNSRMQMTHLWCYTLLHYKLFYASSDSFARCEKIPDSSTIYNFCCELVERLSSESEDRFSHEKIRWQSGEISEEQFKAELFFHLEKNRTHTSTSMKVYEKHIVETFNNDIDTLVEQIMDYDQGSSDQIAA